MSDRDKLYYLIGKAISYIAPMTLIIGTELVCLAHIMLQQKEGEKMDKYDKIYIWHEITKAKLKLRLRELKKLKEARR